LTAQNSFAAAFGGGLDVNVSSRFAVKPIQLEYLMTSVDGRWEPELPSEQSPVLRRYSLPFRREMIFRNYGRPLFARRAAGLVRAPEGAVAGGVAPNGYSPVWNVQLFDRNESSKRPTEERNGPALLAELAGETGGRHFSVDALDDLSGSSAGIGAELREQYMRGYSPTNSALEGKYRRVRVVVPAHGSAVTVNHRAGYYGPAN
jgi:hypothetical protein